MSLTATWNGPWFDSPLFESDLAKRGLDPEREAMVREYRESGILIRDVGLPEELLERVVRETRPLHDNDVPDGTRSRIRLLDIWSESPAVRELAGRPEVLDVLRLLYEREPIPFQTLNFQFGTEQRAHKDEGFFSSYPTGFMCAAWVALEDVGPHNGAIFYYPGSQRIPLIWHDDIGQGHWNPLLQRRYDQDQPRYQNELYLQATLDASGLPKVGLEAKKGSVVFWSSGVVHGGGKIERPGSTRFSQVTHYFFENCAYLTPFYSNRMTGDLYLRRIFDVRTGEMVPNRYYGQEIEGVVDNGYYHVVVDEGPDGRERIRAIPNAELKQRLDVGEKALAEGAGSGLVGRVSKILGVGAKR
jgi:hypothetical protein